MNVLTVNVFFQQIVFEVNVKSARINIRFISPINIVLLQNVR